MTESNQSTNDPVKRDDSNPPEEPILGKSQPLPNPEEPAGYEWHKPMEQGNLPDTKPIKPASKAIEDQPTILSSSAPKEDIPIEIHLEQKTSPPPGITDTLPRKVDEIDLSATRVTPAALQVNKAGRPPAQPGSHVTHATQNGAGVPAPTRKENHVSATAQKNNPKVPVVKNGGKKQLPPGQKGKSKFNFGGCFVKGLVILLFAAVLGIVIAGVFLVYQYFTIASTLPSVDDIRG